MKSAKSSPVDRTTTHDGRVVVNVSKLIRSPRFQEQARIADKLVEKKPPRTNE